MSNKKATIALFGGSFNPPGMHHRRIAEELARHFDKVIVIPCGPRPDKLSTNEVTPVHRAAMVDMTFRNLPKVEVDLFDLEGDSFTRTIDLEKKFAPQGEIWHVVGTDLVRGGAKGNSAIQSSWFNGKELWSKTRFAVLTRMGHEFEHDDLPPHTQIIQMNEHGSSAAIRNAVYARQSIGHMVSPEVNGYLLRHGLYRSGLSTEMKYAVESGNFLVVVDENNKTASEVAKQLPQATNGAPNLIVVVGGDGTMLRAIRKYWRLRVPFYGINTGNFGFLHNPSTSRPTPGTELAIQQLPLLWVEAEGTDGTIRTDLAFNDAWVERATGQVAWIEVVVNGEVRLHKLVADGVLVSTAAGSASYAYAMGASPVPFDTQALIIVGSNVFRPHAWKSAVVPLNSKISFRSLEFVKRPLVGYIDGEGQGAVRGMSVRLSRSAAVELVFEPEHDISTKLARLQFSEFV